MTLKTLAPAKVNLTLEILGRRTDGYHEIRSVMQAVSLCDEIAITTAESLTLEGGSPDAPPDTSNLVWRAAAALNEAAGGGNGARIALTKRIPVGAGLGGGSSDAAATLQVLSTLWRTELPLDRLMAIAASLGSDVPFFLTGGSALAEGRGEALSELERSHPFWLVLAWPDAGLATKRVYARFTLHRSAAREPGVASDAMMATVAAGSLEGIAAALHNDLEPAAFHLCPQAEDVRNALLDAGALGALLTGSGSAVFGLVPGAVEAGTIAADVRSRGYQAVACHTVSLPYEEDE